MVLSNEVVFTVFMRREHLNAPLLSRSRHRKPNLSESSEFTSCDVIADVSEMVEPILARTGPKVKVCSNQKG